ncbi:UdgX family uracil-DNA binding protein [Stenotrophomonas sp. MYb238]|uniref:UdgX family uracil-DNA binding protein n=1 Tax=Stenotrophomonas sp. MYb238 TaxID=2040281 RepID=UPI0012924A8C|nr:UdgX family uracil-DNA binding protein [Stenotrophomonas sp. MYb238]MQP74682.1 UdgX family uracil-DNA binding protein [Stenotrophomonas sp. MYb238]
MARRSVREPPQLAKPVDEVPAGSLAVLRREAADCRRCPLWRHATQTVFGTGPRRAAMMLIGEQPGAHEDLEGQPFVGPAGRLLREALADAGLDAAEMYMTNTVKHFKYEQRGKARLHKRASASEQAACRPWLAAELLQVRPRVVVALGAMAAQTLFGTTFRISRQRGTWQALGEETQALATWHPSAILRMPSPQRERTRAELVADLALAATALA